MDNKDKAKKLADDAKEATKQIKSEDDVKKFLADNKAEILDTAKNLKGEDKENFKQIVNALYNYSNSVKEAKDSGVTGAKLICGLAATVAFLCSLNTIGFILSAPIYSPLLQAAVQKLTGVKESEVNEEMQQQFSIDEKTAKAFADFAAECKEMQKKVTAKRFDIFEYEGQHLAGFWMNLERVASLLSKGYLNMRVANYLDHAGEYILNSNTHKTPKPTDPRDIK